MRRHNYYRKRRTPKKEKVNWYPYKNEFEAKIAKALKRSFEYEPKKHKLKYTTEATYNPDFVSDDLDWLLIEAKGRFYNGSSEARKYIWVKRSHPGKEILFIFSNPNNIAYAGCKRRKDGSFLTMGEWASKNGFAFVKDTHLPPQLIEGKITREWYDKLRDKQHEMYFGR